MAPDRVQGLTVRLHLFHRWSRWHDPEVMRHSPMFPKRGPWRVAIQIRRCETCGKKQTRDI